MPLTVTLIISFSSPTLFHSRLKTFLLLQILPAAAFFLLRDYMISQTFTVTSSISVSRF